MTTESSQPDPEVRERAIKAARSVSPTAKRKHAKELAEAKADLAKAEKALARKVRRDNLRKQGEILRGESA